METVAPNSINISISDKETGLVDSDPAKLDAGALFVLKSKGIVTTLLPSFYALSQV